jgi:hypothetical protein
LANKYGCQEQFLFLISEEKIALIVANQKKELLLAAMFIGRMEPNEEAL